MSIKIIAKVHPFDAKKRIIKESEPKPLYLLYEELNIGLPIEHAHFLIEDEIIKDINKIPKDGQTVYIAVHPGGTPEGTGKGMAIGGALAILAGILVTAISLGSLTGVGVALIGTGIGMLAGGAVLLNLDIPNLKDREKPKQNPSIRGAKNRANQLGFIPVVLGRHLIYPDMAANPHFEIEGNDQYLIQLFCAGYNDIEIEKDSIKLGDTLLKEYSETKDIDKILAGEDSVVKLQILKSGEECSFYKRSVKDENINQLLKHSFEDGKDGSIVRTTPSKTTKINVDIFFYSGLGRYNDSGDVASASVEVACYYKKENDPDSQYSLLGFFNGNKNLIEGNELKTKRFQITKEGLPPDKYTLKFTRVTQDSEDNKIVDAVYVGSIRSFTADRPIRFERQKNLTIVALKIKATERLNGVIDSLNFIAQTKIPAYKGSGQGPASWEEKLTSNPAAILKYVLQGKINSNPVSNEDIDWESFEKWALWCDEKKYSCNAVLSDKATLSELITMITHTARADAVKIDSKFSIVQDIERLSPVQLFTPRNTKSYSQNLLFADIPEAIEFNFIDEASGFKENERVVYDTPKGEPTETEALKKQQETLWGVTNAMQAFKIGRYQYACMHNRPRVHKIDVDLEFLVCTKGDRIQYAGDTGLIGIAYGRVKGIETLNGLTTAVILDEYIEAEKGKTYALRFRKKDGRILIVDTRPLSASYTNKIEFELALNENDTPQEGDLFTFGIKQKECLDLIITSIEPTDEWNASIIAVDYSPEIFGIDDSSYVVPPFDNKITSIDGSISDSGSVEQWKYYYTYNDSEEEPLRPKYDGTRDGWHRLQTKKSIWVSTKNAKSVYEGQWSAPVRLKGEKGEQGIPGKDGMTKFLASLEIQGDYENQLGTYQGQLYRWVNNKWELLNAVMPLNPVLGWDFTNIGEPDGKILKQWKNITSGNDYVFLQENINHLKGRSFFVIFDAEKLTADKSNYPELTIHTERWQHTFLSFYSWKLKRQIAKVDISDVPENIYVTVMNVHLTLRDGTDCQNCKSIVNELTFREIYYKNPIIDFSGNQHNGKLTAGLNVGKKTLVDGSRWETAKTSMDILPKEITTSVCLNLDSKQDKWCVEDVLDNPILNYTYDGSYGNLYNYYFNNKSKGKEVKVAYLLAKKKADNTPIKIVIIEDGWSQKLYEKNILTTRDNQDVYDTAIVTLPDDNKTYRVGFYYMGNTPIKLKVCSVFINDKKNHSYVFCVGDLERFDLRPASGICVFKACDRVSTNECVISIPTNLLCDKKSTLTVKTKVTKTSCTKQVYLNGKLFEEKMQQGDFSYLYKVKNREVYIGDCNGEYHNFMIFDRLLTEQEILWLHLNPQYPVKNYTLADWQLDPDNPNSSIKNLTPKYLGVTETVPDTRVVTITKGERLGAVDANPGDWVLSGRTIGGWKVGVCYRWSGAQWQETNNPQYSQATLQDALDLCREMGKSEDIPAVQFANKLVALEAFIESLSAQVVYFQKSVASLVSSNPKVGDQMIFMGHNYRQYDPNEPFSFGIDELSYKGYHNGKDTEIWRSLMKTSQIKSLAGVSILSLFLTGCLQANGGVEIPIGSVVSQDKLKGLNAGLIIPPVITLDKKRAISANWFSGDDKTVIYSDDGLRTFKKIKPNINIDFYFTVFQNKFYATKNNTAEYYSSMDGRIWTKEGVIENSSRAWSVIRDDTEQKLVFHCWETGERKLIAGVANSIQQPPPSKPQRVALLKNSKYLIAYDNDIYDGLSVSIDGGQTWEHYDDVLSECKGERCCILQWNETFYFFKQNFKNFYYSNSPFDWNKQLTKYPVCDMISTDNNILCFSFDGKKTLVENIFTKKVITEISTFLKYARYYSEHKIIIVIGVIEDNHYIEGAQLFIIDGGVLTGSGITNFETADNYLAAQFGNGLQMVAYSGNSCPKSFAGKAYTLLGADGDKLKIGRWF